MDFILIVSSATLQDEIASLFDDLKITGFTCIPEVTGSGKGGGTRLNDEVWPGENKLYMAAVTAEQSKALKDWVRAYREKSVREGLKLFSLAMTEMI